MSGLVDYGDLVGVQSEGERLSYSVQFRQSTHAIVRNGYPEGGLPVMAGWNTDCAVSAAANRMIRT